MICRHPRHADQPWTHSSKERCKSCKIILDLEASATTKIVDDQKDADEKVANDGSAFWNFSAKVRKEDRDKDSNGGRGRGRGKGRAR